MRIRWGILALTLAVLWAAVSHGDTRSARAQAGVSLLDALDQGLVEAQFEATGAASGHVVNVRLRRLTAEPLTLAVPPGLALLNENTGEQDLVVRILLGASAGGSRYNIAGAIVLIDDMAHVYALDGYCLEANNDNPSEGARLSPAGLANPEVVRVMLAANDLPGAGDEISAIQAALWAVTDDLTEEQLASIGYALSPDERTIARTILEQAGLDPARYRLFGA